MQNFENIQEIFNIPVDENTKQQLFTRIHRAFQNNEFNYTQCFNYLTHVDKRRTPTLALPEAKEQATIIKTMLSYFESELAIIGNHENDTYARLVSSLQECSQISTDVVVCLEKLTEVQNPSPLDEVLSAIFDQGDINTHLFEGAPNAKGFYTGPITNEKIQKWEALQNIVALRPLHKLNEETDVVGMPPLGSVGILDREELLVDGDPELVLIGYQSDTREMSNFIQKLNRRITNLWHPVPGSGTDSESGQDQDDTNSDVAVPDAEFISLMSRYLDRFQKYETGVLNGNSRHLVDADPIVYHYFVYAQGILFLKSIFTDLQDSIKLSLLQSKPQPLSELFETAQTKLQSILNGRFQLFNGFYKDYNTGTIINRTGHGSFSHNLKRRFITEMECDRDDNIMFPHLFLTQEQVSNLVYRATIGSMNSNLTNNDFDKIQELYNAVRSTQGTLSGRNAIESIISFYTGELLKRTYKLNENRCIQAGIIEASREIPEFQRARLLVKPYEYRTYALPNPITLQFKTSQMGPGAIIPIYTHTQQLDFEEYLKNTYTYQFCTAEIAYLLRNRTHLPNPQNQSTVLSSNYFRNIVNDNSIENVGTSSGSGLTNSENGNNSDAEGEGLMILANNQ